MSIVGDIYEERIENLEAAHKATIEQYESSAAADRAVLDRCNTLRQEFLRRCLLALGLHEAESENEVIKQIKLLTTANHDYRRRCDTVEEQIVWTETFRAHMFKNQYSRGAIREADEAIEELRRYRA